MANANTMKVYAPVRVKARAVARFKRRPEVATIDRYRDLLHDLFLLRNPRHRFDKNYRRPLREFIDAAPEGNWFYFPWSRRLVRFLPEDMHQELRTGRNRHLITAAEQRRYYRATVGIAGLSVGSHVALTLAMTGGARHIKLADPDAISGDNLNRIRAGFQNVGINKAVAVARQIYEMNPYAKAELYPQGITEANSARFLRGLTVLVEEMDNPYLKVKMRFLARERGIPVIMAADNGDGIIADVERFDLNRKYPILHGIIGKMTPEDLKNIPPRELPRVIARIAGADRADLRMLHSVTEVGKSLYSWPQLGTAATLCGSVLAYLARQIILDHQKIKSYSHGRFRIAGAPHGGAEARYSHAIKSGRYEANPAAIFEAGYHTRAATKKRDRSRTLLLKKLGLA